MGQITITGLDERVIATLTAQADAAGRSLEDQVRALLEREAQQDDRLEALAALQRLGERIGPLPADWPGAAALIREDRHMR